MNSAYCEIHDVCYSWHEAQPWAFIQFCNKDTHISLLIAMGYPVLQNYVTAQILKQNQPDTSSGGNFEH
jgi:hypothetical protein